MDKSEAVPTVSEVGAVAGTAVVSEAMEREDQGLPPLLPRPPKGWFCQPRDEGGERGDGGAVRLCSSLVPLNGGGMEGREAPGEGGQEEWEVWKPRGLAGLLFGWLPLPLPSMRDALLLLWQGGMMGWVK